MKISPICMQKVLSKISWNSEIIWKYQQFVSEKDLFLKS